jgi:serine/threonine protein kinase
LSELVASGAVECAETVPAASDGNDIFRNDSATGRSGLPQKLGDFEIIQVVGRGGMGVVYKVHDVALDRVAALKIMGPFGPPSGEVVDRFFRAARLWARLKHPSIVPIYNIGQVDGTPYVVSEFIEGVDLSTLISPSGGFPAVDAARIIVEVADALSFAHAHGVIHRDVKPSNIMIKPDGHAVLVDFGLARPIAFDGEASLSALGTIVGTPSFMSPEQAQGRISELGLATDVYSLGATLYAALVGQPPFRCENIMETFRQILEAEPVPPRRLVPSVPRDLETICLKALAKRPADRYSSASAMAEDLRRFLDGSPITTRPHRAPVRLVRWVRRRPALRSMILLAFASLAFAAFREFKYQEPRASSDSRDRRDLRRIINRGPEVDLRRAVELGEARLRDQSKSRELSCTLASNYHRLGDLLVNTDRLADAASAYERAITLLCHDLRNEASHVPSRIELAEILSNLGEAFWALGRKSDARATYSQALSVNQRLALDHPELSACRETVARMRNRLKQLRGATR